MVKTKTPLDQTSLNPDTQTAYLALAAVPDPALEAHPLTLTGQAVVLVDPLSGKALNFTVQSTGAGQFPTASSLVVLASSYVYDPRVVAWVQVRTPTIYKNVVAVNAGSTAVWTPGVGIRWRLMGFCITIMQGTTAAAGVDVSLLDVASDFGIGVVVCTAAMLATPGAAIILRGTIGNGKVAAATNTALNVNLSTALAVGGVSVQVWGTEE